LLQALQAGKFCYVLNSRQMGKSSLCVRTMSRLAAGGARCAFVDLTKIGGRNVTPDQWYAGLTVEVGRPLGLRVEMLRNWQEEPSLSPMQRFFSALRDVALEKIDAPVVIFVDEIDATRSLPFSANEFFAGIRECYNRRVHDPAYKRLTFCLLGVAVPGDLMADITTTPFNIGERIVLADFSKQEAVALAVGLGADGNQILERILYWTSGHPFLTQSLAATAASRKNVLTTADVDRLVAELLFQAKARETNINLADVGNRVLNGYSDPDQISKYRADILSVYEKVLRGGEVFDDESNRLVTVLKLAGIVRVEDRKLKIRNRIYEHVFDRTWVRENMPGAEIRRQRRAYIKGVLRTAAVSAVIFAIIAGLAWRVKQERDRANYEVYVATMNLMRPTWEQNNLGRMQDLLDATKDNPARGWEWDYWNHMAHLEVAAYPKRFRTTFGTTYASNGKIYIREEGKIREYSPDTGQIVDLMPMLGQGVGLVAPTEDGKHLFEYDGSQTVQVIDLINRRRLAKLDNFGFLNVPTIAPDGRWIVAGRVDEFQINPFAMRSAVLWDAETGQSTTLPTPPIRSTSMSPNGKLVAISELDRSGGAEAFRAIVREFGTWKILASFDTLGDAEAFNFNPTSDRLATSSRNGWIQIWDLSSRREIARTHPTDGIVYNMDFSRDGAWMATSSVDRVGRLYDISGQGLKLLRTFRDAGLLTIAPDKSRLAASFPDLRFYDPKTYVETPSVSAGVDQTGYTAIYANKALARFSTGGKVYELDPLSAERRELKWLPGAPGSFPGSGESWGHVLTRDQKMQIVDFDTHEPVFAIPLDDRMLLAEEFPDHRRVALIFKDNRFQIWDAKERRMLKELHTVAAIVGSRPSPDGRWLATTSLGETLSLWDTSTWNERRMSRAGGRVWNVMFSPDGSRLLVTVDPENVEVWDVNSATLVGKLAGHSQSVNDAAYSPDGRRIVTASADLTIRIWDAATFRELTSLTGHNRFVNQARFTDDGGSIISIDDQGTAKAWLTKTPPGLVAPAMAAQGR
jgi:WD40 repeat protein